jgi:hypothetical protein
MRNVRTALAAVLAMLALGACAKKEEAPAAPTADAAPTAAAAPTETPPADENSEDAEQSGGDKVKP